MSLFEIKYSFDIQDIQDDSLSYSEKGTFEIEASSQNELSRSQIKGEILKIARTHCQKTYERVSYYDYYGVNLKK